MAGTNEALAVNRVLTLADIGKTATAKMLQNYGIGIEWLAAKSPIVASFWGEPEAGIAGCRIFVRDDTPVHSMLHEACHIVCMAAHRRTHLDRDAGGDDLEEAAVCYLQIVLGDYLPGVGAARVMADMDAWGYSFRLGKTARWFADDAEDARHWLVQQGLLTPAGQPIFRLRDS